MLNSRLCALVCRSSVLVLGKGISIGPVAMLLFMLLALCALIGLVGYLLVSKYRSAQPIREAEIVFIPIDILQRRARNWAIAASMSLILYGLLKGIAHSAVVAVNGIEGFGNIPGFLTAQSSSGSWFLFLCTLGVAVSFLTMGVWRLLGSRLALWFVAPAVAIDFLVSLVIAMNRFGPSTHGRGLIFAIAACLIPIVVGSLLIMALNMQLLVGLKTQMDARAQASAGA
jgi:hypothetical protein